jgi:hypothetical protein
MIALSCRLFRIGPEARPGADRPRRAHSLRPGDGLGSGGGRALERRVLQTVVALTGNASPMILQPIDPMNQPHAVRVARTRPVTISGSVTENQAVLPSVRFQVVDEYGRDQPSGTLVLQPATIPPAPPQPGSYFYSARIGLNLARRPGDRDGRQYTIFVTALDPESTLTITFPAMTPRHRHGHADHHGSRSR